MKYLKKLANDLVLQQKLLRFLFSFIVVSVLVKVPFLLLHLNERNYCHKFLHVFRK